MWVYEYDENGLFLRPVELKTGETMPKMCTPKRPQTEGHFRSKFDEALDEWVEGLPEEVEQIKNQEIPLVPIEVLKKQQTDLAFELMIRGVL